MKTYHADDSVVVRQTEVADFAGIQALCRRVYSFCPPWGNDQLQSHQTAFSQGQIVVADRETGNIIGMCASLIVFWDDYEIEDAWRDFTDHGYFSNHDPKNGRTLYGAEVIVDPECRGRGLGKLLYSARRQLVADLKLLRIRAGARLRGYSAYRKTHTPLQYLLEVVQGKIFDPTISFQMKQGFHVMALVPGYLPDDPETLGWAVAIEWLNPVVATVADAAAQVARYEQLFGPMGQQGHLLYKGVVERQTVFGQSACSAL